MRAQEREPSRRPTGFSQAKGEIIRAGLRDEKRRREEREKEEDGRGTRRRRTRDARGCAEQIAAKGDIRMEGER